MLKKERFDLQKKEKDDLSVKQVLNMNIPLKEVVVIVAFVVGLAGNWFYYKNKIEDFEKRITINEEKLEEPENTLELDGDIEILSGWIDDVETKVNENEIEREKIIIRVDTNTSHIKDYLDFKVIISEKSESNKSRSRSNSREIGNIKSDINFIKDEL